MHLRSHNLAAILRERRPAMARTIFLKVRVTEAERDTAHEVAERQGLTISQMVRKVFGLDTAPKDQAD
jgi:hypothetical protein